MISACDELNIGMYIRKRKSGDLAILPEHLRITPESAVSSSTEQIFYDRSYGESGSPQASSDRWFAMDGSLGFALEFRYAPDKWYPISFISFNVPHKKTYVAIEQFQGGDANLTQPPRFFRQKLYSVNHRELLLDLLLKVAEKIRAHHIGIRTSQSSAYNEVREDAVRQSDRKHTTYDSFAETKGFEFMANFPATHRWKEVTSTGAL